MAPKSSRADPSPDPRSERRPTKKELKAQAKEEKAMQLEEAKLAAEAALKKEQEKNKRYWSKYSDKKAVPTGGIEDVSNEELMAALGNDAEGADAAGSGDAVGSAHAAGSGDDVDLAPRGSCLRSKTPRRERSAQRASFAEAVDAVDGPPGGATAVTAVAVTAVAATAPPRRFIRPRRFTRRARECQESRVGDRRGVVILHGRSRNSGGAALP